MTVEFENDAQKEAFGKVSKWIREIYGEIARQRSEGAVFLIPKGSTFANVAVFPWGDNEAIVRTSAIVVKGASMTPELMKFLLTKNHGAIYGGFGIDDDGDIWFTHTIYGSTLDKEELRHSVMAVLYTADKLDDEIISRWGGTRALDE